MNLFTQLAARLLPWSLGLAIASVPFYKGLFNVAIVIYALVWLAALPCRNGFGQRWRNQPALWWLLALTAWVVLGLFYGEATGEDLKRPMEFVIRMLIVLMAALAMDVHQRSNLLTAFVIAQSVVLVAVYALASGVNAYWVDVSLTDHISQNLMQSFLVAVALWRSKSAATGSARWAWRVLAMLAAYGILMLSDGRTGYLALFAVLLVFIVWGRPWWFVPVGIASVVALAVSAYVLNDGFERATDLISVEAKMNGEQAEQSSVGARLAMWAFATELIDQKPILGWGSGGYPGQAKTYFKDQATCSVTCAHTHNQFLFFGVENGLIGVVLYVGLLITLMRNARDSKNEEFGGVVLSYVAVLIVDSLTHGPFWIAREFYFFSSLMPLMLLNASVETMLEQST